MSIAPPPSAPDASHLPRTSQIPLRDFFKSPEQTAFALSPNNTQIAFMKPYLINGNRRMNIFVQQADGDLKSAKQVTFATERDIYGYFWVTERILVYATDVGGDENTRIYSVHVETGVTRDLTPYQNIKAGLLDELEHDEAHILITLNKDNPSIHDVYRLHVETAALTLVAKNPGNVSGWLTDHQGNVRVATTSDGVHTSLLYRKHPDDAFTTLLTVNFKTSVAPIAFTKDNQRIYVASNRNRDTTALYVFNPDTCQEEKLLFAHPEVDVNALVLCPRSHEPICAHFFTDKPGIHFFDPARKRQYQTIKRLLADTQVSIHYAKTETRLIVTTHSDVHRGSYYLYNPKLKSVHHLIDLAPWLPTNRMAPMKPIQFHARDGLPLHGYLTLPLHSKGQPLPIIVHPHGGPWARDYWGFQSEVQWLAHQGYGVLQINFRGSTGYGRTFWEKSFKQWGKAMQDDITDGVHWLIHQGIADPERIGIYGASYGGYATLAGLCFTPDLYACGIDYVGISSLFSFMESIPPYWTLYLDMLHEMVGHPEHDKEQLRTTSPFYHARNIKAPLMIAQGANDPRVKQSESDQMVQAMKANQTDVVYMVRDNEGHGFQNEENRFAFYETMLAFLHKHMPPDYQNDSKATSPN